ncbi:hypothetical protein JCM10908_007092 [Rhodotorula pacifica]|uniref:uncharacterized protein n=1 Tax=Rhodotorula pacifica TaxID=1495444 RepID=UPI003178F15C
MLPLPRKSSPSSPSGLLAPFPVRMSYRIGRSEQGVLTFEPYKSHLLALWRFKTPEIARTSAQRITDEFDKFEKEGDFVGCDMARKFLQMGMTRSTRYANRAGGRKYSPTDGSLLPKSTNHPGAAAKLESARIFREAWEEVKEREGYKRLRKEWEGEKKQWEKEGRPGFVEEEENKVGIEGKGDEGTRLSGPSRRRSRKVKSDSDSDSDSYEIKSEEEDADAEPPTRRKTRSATTRHADNDESKRPMKRRNVAPKNDKVKQESPLT